jgi:tetratricopeptide (TPR) repeat protein
MEKSHFRWTTFRGAGHLQLLLEDTECLESGFEYYYVVDFAAIYSYVYKTSSTPFLSLPGDSDKHTFARHQMALQTLFSKNTYPLLLIPPYSAELSNHLRSLATNLGLAALNSKGFYRDKLSRLIRNSEHFREFVLLRSKPSETMDDEAFRAALEVGKEYFPELHSAVAFAFVEGRDTIRQLFQDKILRDSDELIPECRDIDYTSGNTDDWYRKINKSRYGKRAYQSRTDAIACTYLEIANERLNAEQKIVVFVSPSRSVESVLAERLLISPRSRPKIGVARNLTYCLLAFIHKNDKTAITDSLTTVTRLLELYESPIPVDWRVEQRRDEAARDWNRCENLFLISDSSVTQLVTAKPGDIDADFLDLLKQLHTAAEHKDGISQEIEAKFAKLHSETTELNKLIPSNRTFETFRHITVQARSRGVRVLFPGLQDELPLPLVFVDANVKRLAQNFQELKNHNYSEDSVMALRTHILEAASQTESSPETHLLAGYVLALERRYEAALVELSAGREKARDKDEELRELLFVSAAIHRKLYHAKEASELLEEALRVDPKDPRLNVEYAKALWLQWRDQDDVQAADKCLNNALKHLEVASSAPRPTLDKWLRAQIENVSAFIHTERAIRMPNRKAESLRAAHNHIKQLEHVLPENEWIGRFFDTRGYWCYAKAEAPETDVQERKRLLEVAARDMKRALGFEEVGSDHGVRREHQAQVMEALKKLYSQVEVTEN